MDKPNASYGYWLLIAIFVIATCGLVYELVAGALASYLLGDSVRQFSFIIGVYLFSMGIGAYLAKFIHHKLLEKFILIEIWIGVIGGLSATLLFVLFNYVLYFEPLLYTIVFSIGCLVGLEIPLLMQLMQDELQFKDLVSNVFAVDYIGALVASVLFPLVLVPYLGLMRTSLFFGMLNIAIAWVLAVALRQRVSMAIRLQVKAILVFLLLLTTFIFANDILAWSEKNLYDETILLSKTTPYQRIVLTHQKNNCKLYLNNNLQFASADEYRYHEALVHPVLSLAECVDQVLVLGGGDGLALREILKYPDVQQITLVDLDREMTEICSNNHLLTQFNQNAFQNPKVKVINQDAFVWLQHNDSQFDVAIVDFPDPSNYSVGKLYTQRFYQSLQKVLSPQAMVSVQTTSPFVAPKSFWCIQKTLASVFAEAQAYHIYVPSFGEWGFSLATQQDFSPSNVPFRTVSPLRFYDFRFNKLCDFPSDMRAKDIAINRLDNQILVRYFDEEWNK